MQLPVKNIRKALLFVAVFTILLLSGCYTSKKADKELARVFKRFPDKMAKIARDSFPCHSLRADTAYLPGDTIVYIECPVFEDTPSVLVHPPLVTVGPAPAVIKLPTWNKVINRWFEDSAKIKLALSYAGEIKAQADKQIKQALEAAKKANEDAIVQKGKTTGWRLTALVLGILLFFLLFALAYILSKRSK